MKKILSVMLFALVFIGCQKVPAGHVGIKVYLLGGDKGVDSEELDVGRYWIGINEELYLFPTFKQNYTWTANKTEGSPNDESFTFQTTEGMEVGADIGITYHLERDKVHSIFQQYRRGVDEITDKFLRNHVRSALNTVASTKNVEDVYGNGKAKFLKEVLQAVRDKVGPQGIIVEDLYLVNRFRLPNAVTNALNRKIEATQRAEQRENELREAEAEAQKKIATAKGEAESKLEIARAEAKSKLVQAKAEAKANQIVSRSLTAGLIKYETVKNWNGELPRFTGNAVPMIDLK